VIARQSRGKGIQLISVIDLAINGVQVLYVWLPAYLVGVFFRTDDQNAADSHGPVQPASDGRCEPGPASG
jgi:hypothetical protein